MGMPAARLTDMTVHGGTIMGPGCPTVLINKLPAIRVGDMHVCPMVTPGVPPIPHVGGPITGPGSPVVLIGKMPASVVGDMAVCVGPPSTVVLGSMDVFIGNAPCPGGGGGGGGGMAIPKASQAGSGGGGGGGSSSSDDSSSNEDSSSDSSTTEESSNENDDTTDEAATEEEEVKELFIKDIVEILEQIESDEGYPAARFFASHLDYKVLCKMAKTKDEKPDNDPNQMPTRYMLLPGSEDGSLPKDPHPDNFEDAEEHEINVANLQKGLTLLGYDVEGEDGTFGEKTEQAFFQFLSKGSNTKPKKKETTHIVEEDEDLGSIADEYGMVSWKYLYELNKDAIGDNPDLLAVGTELTIPGWESTTGDEMIEEKGFEPRQYMNGTRYRYVWVPFSLTLTHNNKMALEEFEEEQDILIYKEDTEIDLYEGKIKCSDDIKLLLPKSKDFIIGIKGLPLFLNGKIHKHREDLMPSNNDENSTDDEEYADDES